MAQVKVPKGSLHIYDMGDGWEHELRIEKILPAEPDIRYPRFIDGAMAGPPEDIGGVPGFYEFLDAIEAPEHHNLLGWYGGPVDPEALDEAAIKKRLARTGPRKKPKSS